MIYPSESALIPNLCFSALHSHTPLQGKKLTNFLYTPLTRSIWQTIFILFKGQSIYCQEEPLEEQQPDLNYSLSHIKQTLAIIQLRVPSEKKLICRATPGIHCRNTLKSTVSLLTLGKLLYHTVFSLSLNRVLTQSSLILMLLSLIQNYKHFNHQFIFSQPFLDD